MIHSSSKYNLIQLNIKQYSNNIQPAISLPQRRQKNNKVVTQVRSFSSSVEA